MTQMGCEIAKYEKGAVVVIKVRTLEVQELKKELLPSDKGI